MPYRSTVLAGHLALGTAGVRVLGLLWLLAALGFMGVGAGLAFRSARRPWRPWRGARVAVALLSLALCLLAWPDSASGAVIDGALLAVLFAGPRFTAAQSARTGKEEAL
jgi:hypothetical protein